MRWLRLLIPFLCVISLTACTSDRPGSPDNPIDVSVVLAPGETRAIAGASFRLQFDTVVGDSRCPGDAICITGGDAIVRVRVLADGVDASYDLHTGTMQPARHGSVTIALTELSPYPFSSLGPIKPEDYRVTLRITR